MPMRIVADVLNSATDGATGEADVGAQPNGQLQLWTGTPPANVTDDPSVTETLLAVFDFQNPAFGVATDGIADANGLPIATTGLADGTVGFVRVLNANQNNAGALWDDDDVGTSGTRVVLNTLSVSTGVDLDLTGYSFSASPIT